MNKHAIFNELLTNLVNSTAVNLNVSVVTAETPRRAGMATILTPSVGSSKPNPTPRNAMTKTICQFSFAAAKTRVFYKAAPVTADCRSLKAIV